MAIKDLQIKAPCIFDHQIIYLSVFSLKQIIHALK